MNLVRILALLALGGCFANSLSGKSELNAADTGLPPQDDTARKDSTDTAEEPAPAWYVVHAELAIVDGMAAPDGAQVWIEVVDADQERIDCVVTLAEDTVFPGDVEPDGTVTWWTVEMRPADDVAPCATLPERLALGVGDLHPDARARLGAVGHDDIADSLYGAWLRADEGEAAVYGYAGTEADFTGDDVAILPPPDGTYQLAPLYLVALPEPL